MDSSGGCSWLAAEASPRHSNAAGVGDDAGSLRLDVAKPISPVAVIIVIFPFFPQ